MSSNVGLTTPRGSGTSGYVQRNTAFMKPRNTGSGAPYPPLSGANNYTSGGFKQRVPDKKILEHDRLRAIEVLVMEERERLEEENERVEEEQSKEAKMKSKKVNTKKDKEEGEEQDSEEENAQGKVLSEEQIDERCEELRARLLKEMEQSAASGAGAGGKGKMGPPRDRRNLKSYQVHELAEAKIEESERLRRALGIKENRETGEISSTRFERRRERD
ncbi:Pre-mRNA-splicing factor cwc21 [Penicillium waksmanii]|uniref:Pre-mRNA-splicing factor cwc21 n=1 Tax=Penicillium waksmanii TaxID=69791 RepID=UPI002547F966|nr:Pre-mRNA-splicing factor cwc21 [Penicillium waksmanii]KAJ5980075.1 Pre-mRNA-splicing factor cwc21 [Penicillium waksmanii]